jgi:hypothetical protein
MVPAPTVGVARMEQTRKNRDFRAGTPFSPATGPSAPINKKTTTHPKIPCSFATVGKGRGPSQHIGTKIGPKKPEGGENFNPLIHGDKKKEKPTPRKKKQRGKNKLLARLIWWQGGRGQNIGGRITWLVVLSLLCLVGGVNQIFVENLECFNQNQNMIPPPALLAKKRVEPSEQKDNQILDFALWNVLSQTTNDSRLLPRMGSDIVDPNIFPI